MNVVPERTDQRQVGSEIEVLGCGTSGRRDNVWEGLPLRCPCGAGSEWLLKQGRRGRSPVLTERHGSENPIQGLVLNGGVKDARTNPNAGLSRPTEDLTQKPLRKVGGIGHAQPGREVVVPGWRQRSRNSRVAGVHQTRWSRGVLD